MHVCVHRGTKQIGGTCIEIEYSKERLILDFGLPLDGNPTDATLVPNIFGGDLRGCRQNQLKYQLTKTIT